MAAKASKPRRANSGPWAPGWGSSPRRAGSISSGITPSEYAQRQERYLYLKRKGLTFV